MNRWVLSLSFILSSFLLQSQNFDTVCLQQKMVVNALMANHFDPPVFNRPTNLEVLDLFIREADERNIFFLSTDKIKLQQTIMSAPEEDVFCVLARRAY